MKKEHLNSRLRLRPAVVLLSLATTPLWAGSYTNDFSAGTTGLTVYNRGAVPGPEVRATGGNPGAYFKLTDPINGEAGTVIFPNFEGGTAVEAFDFSIDCRIGAGTSPPADGFSINFARPGDDALDDGNGFSSSPSGEANLPEEGTKTGLAIGFDAYFSGGADVIGFSVKLDNVTVTQVAIPTQNPADPADATALETGPQGVGVEGLSWQPFRANLKSDGRLDVYWKGVKVIDNLVTGYTPSPGQIVFAGRTGGLNAAFHFDNMSLTTTPVSKAQLTSGVLSNSGYTIKVTDLVPAAPLTPSEFQATTTGPNAITLSVDGVPVTLAPGNVSKTGGVTTIQVPSPTVPDPGSLHTFTISGKDQNGSVITASSNARAPHFPVTMPGPAGTVGTWGMREWRKGSELTPAGLTGNTPLGSIVTQVRAIPDGDPTLTNATGVPVLNHSDPDDPGGKGNFNNDLPFIGNLAATPDNFVVVIGKTQITVPAAGQYTFAAHSDDGFGLRVSGGPAGNTGRFVSVTGAGTSIDAGDAQTAVFPDYTGDSNLHAVYEFSAAGTYDVLAVAFEGGGGANWELAWAQGSFGSDRDTSNWALVGTPTDPSLPPFTPKYVTSLATPPGTDGNFGIRTYLNALGTVDGTPVDNLQRASDFLATTTRAPNGFDTVDASRNSLNGEDPLNGAGGVLPGNGDPFPGDTDGGQDNVVTAARGRIVVPATSDYTFWAQGDDGFMLRIKGVNGSPNPKWTRATQGGNEAAGRFEMSNPNVLFYENGTGNSDTRGVINLPAGEYDLEYIHFEGTGGFWYELTAAQGAWPHGGPTPPNGWQAVGYQGNGSVPLPGILDPGWTVESSPPGRPEFSATIAGAEAAINATLLDPAAPAAKISVWDNLNFTDPELGGDGSFLPNNPWPLNTSADDENYAMRATGVMHVTVAGDYLLGFQGDDGGYISINGPGNPVFSAIEFTNLPANAVLAEEVPGSGSNNMIQVDIGTGNSRTYGRTTLAAGDYTIKTLVFEGGGNSWWEVIGAGAGGGRYFTIPLLTKGPGATATDANGLLLTEQPQPPMKITDVSLVGGQLSVTFNSALGENYSLEYTTGFQPAGAPASPLKWNVAGTAANFPGDGTTTTVTVIVQDLTAGFGGQLPDESKVFVRIRRLAP